MVDISYKSDLTIAVMNLIEIEMHSQNSYFSTNNKDWLLLKEKVRKIRSKYMKELVSDNDDSEKWCISKHMLSSVFRLIESGDKLFEEDEEKAMNLYEDAFFILNEFYKLNFQE